MTYEIGLVLGILSVALLLFITGWVRMDVVALFVLGSLALTGLVSPSEALSGFSSPAVVTVWAILIISEALVRTGVAKMIGHFVLRMAGNSDTYLLIIIMFTVGILSGYMNSIGVVSLFLPVLIDISRRRNQPPSKFLMPLSIAALLGGMTTLIGTPSNILISESLHNFGLRPFQMFDYTPIGMAALFAGSLYMVIIGRKLLPRRDITKELENNDLSDVDAYDLRGRMVFLHITEDSHLAGKTLAESRLGSAVGLNVVAIMRNDDTKLAPESDFRLRSGDKLLVEGRLDRLSEYHQNHLVFESTSFPIEKLASDEIELIEAFLERDSELIGKTLRQSDFRDVLDLIVIAIKRGDRIFRTNIESINLQAEDILLIQGRKLKIKKVQEEKILQISKPRDLHIYKLDERLLTASIPDGSALIGKTIIEGRLGDAFGLSILGIEREGETILMPSTQEKLQRDDNLLLKGRKRDLLMIQGLQNLEIETGSQPDLVDLESEKTGLAEVILAPHSTLEGKTLRELNFRTKYGLNVLAIWRQGRAYRSNLRDMAIHFGDALLLYGARQQLKILASEPDFLVLTEEAQALPRFEKAPMAILIMLSVLLPAILGWIPIAISAVVGVALMVITGCLTMEEAYQSIDWQAVFLIAGMLPLGIALDQTGAASYISNGVINLAGGLGILGVMGAIFILAALATQVMPNPAVAVLLAPIAISVAENMGVSPYPMVMTVAIAASAAFLTPVAHSTNVLVMGPGGYRFGDYVRVGFPLLLITLFVVVLVIPIFLPF